MSKYLRKLKGIIWDEGLTQKDIADHLATQGFKFTSPGYVARRMQGLEDWTTEEMYALADWLKIPDDELLTYFPRRTQPAPKIRRVM